jgi:hypothetical protein
MGEGLGVACTAIECAPWERARETSNARGPGRRMFSEAIEKVLDLS